MDTPVCDFVQDYLRSGSMRLHMPGHKGIGPIGCEALDLTEIPGADVLYHAEGILAQSQENAARLFGAAKTLYSTEGSSLSIRAMLYLALLWAKSQGKAPKIAAGRNAHKVFITACALLDLPVDWLYPETHNNLLACEITPQALETYFAASAEPPAAVYITSPDYLGNLADIRGLAEVCHHHGALLLVDNAHGAYLRFLPHSLHPMDLGADLCCDSAHKTLPVLTGGGYLHISPAAPAFLSRQAENAMALFASTSPSYLILQSLDAANAYLADDYPAHLPAFIRQVDLLKQQLLENGFVLAGQEPLKLTLTPKAYGYTGTALAALLEEQGLFCEFCDPDFLVLMLTPELTPAQLSRLEKVLIDIPRKPAISALPPMLPMPKQCCTARQALFSPSLSLPVSECLGKVLAQATVSCPPAIPPVVCGEILDETAIACLTYYGIDTCQVLA